METFSEGAVTLLAACGGLGILALGLLEAVLRGGRSSSRCATAEARGQQILSPSSERAIDQRVALLEAEGALPAGWTARDARRLLRIAARRGHFIRSSCGAQPWLMSPE